MSSRPDAYSKAFERLAMFAAEEPDWDGNGGVPASSYVVADARAFIDSAIQNDLLPPSLVLHSNGNVSVVWNKPGEIYIGVLATGRGSYSYALTSPQGLIGSGNSETMGLNGYLLEKLVEMRFTLADDFPYRKAFGVLDAISRRSTVDPEAQAKVVVATKAFLDDSISKGLPEPLIHRQGAAAVSATWQDSNGWFIQAEIMAEGIYTYAISRCPSLPGDPAPLHPGVLVTGVSKSMQVVPELADYLRKMV